jgi:peptidoglycan/LPS O-acetylase OafA/YrhL
MQVPAVIRYLIIVVSGTGVLWFIQVLWVYSLLLVPIRKIEKDRLWKAGSRTGILLLTAMAVPVWAAAQILNTPVIAVYRFGFYAAAFFLGYFVFSHEEVMDRLRKHFGWLLMAALVLGISFCVINFGKNYADAPVNRTFLFTAYAWFASLAILGGAAGYLDFETPFTRWMAGHSFGLYVFHYLGISTVALLIGRSGIFPPALVYACSLAAGFAAGYILYEVISRIPVYRWAVLGIKKTRSAR